MRIWFAILVRDLFCHKKHVQYDFISTEHVLQQPQMQLCFWFQNWGQWPNLAVFIVCYCIIFKGDSQKTFDILDLTCWKLELQFVFLQCLKQGQLLWKKTNAKINGMALCLCWQSTVCMYSTLYIVNVCWKGWAWSRSTSCYMSQGCSFSKIWSAWDHVWEEWENLKWDI